MIHYFEVENFYSIRDRQVVDLEISSKVPVDDIRHFQPPGESGRRYPKVVALFGANGSGKTTALRSLSFAERFARRSFNDYEPNQPIDVLPFAQKAWQRKPTRLIVQFSAPAILERPLTYRYELEIMHQGPSNHVKLERLSTRRDGERFRRLFDRQGSEKQSVVKTYGSFELPQDDPRLQVRSNVSLISNLVQFNFEPAREIVEAISSINHNIIVDKFDYGDDFANRFYNQFPKTLASLKSKLKTIDVGIEDVKLEMIDGKPRPLFKHVGLDSNQKYYYESSGTKKFYCIFPIINVSLEFGGASVIDEIDSDLHPLLIPEIMNWFYFSEKQNGGQLIMSCHHASLFDTLTKEEVWFAEKSEDGCTEIYPLAGITGVRRNTNLYKKYIGGSFGAVPRLG